MRLRHQPTTSARILDVLYPGDRATVVRGSVDGWTKVTFHGQTGYVASRYLNGAHTTAGKPKPAKPAQSSKQVRTVVDKHRTITRNDPTLDWGTTKVETKGVDGRIRITYRNGREVSRQIVVKRVDEVILHGTKDVITTKTVDVPFKTITKDDPNLDWGTSRVGTKGVTGKARVTYKNGREIKRETITEPVTQIVYKGSRPVVTTKDVPIDYKTVKRNDPTLDHGKTKVETKGVKGVARVTYRNGKEIKRETIKEPVTEVIRVGTKDVVTTKDVKVPFKTVTKKDPNLPEGKTKVLTEGHNGVVRITYKNGREIKRETIKEPVNKVVAVGTKKKDVITTKEVKVPFKTVKKNDPDLPEGTTKVVQQGREGVDRVTYKNGREIKREHISKPVNKIIHVGTKKKPKPSKKPYITFEKCGTPSSTYPGMLDVKGTVHGTPGTKHRDKIWITGTQNGEPFSYTFENGEILDEIGTFGETGFNHWAYPSMKNLKCHGKILSYNK
ncbi:G5 domain-containing protein [Cutibacterium granulosum]|uniref:G5 domain-containing protein n=1 Tax=Cutibacterium granulosum TaxID=33011 RepID=UPI002B236043|nr:G5 domain-containing protein [Cutibacterium granulosum]MEA5640407.1 G5 domain-containing protein [Cutibacterium granulosum]